MDKEQTDQLKGILKMAGIIGLVLLIGFFAVNQYLSYRYKALFLMRPCDACAKANPEQESCVTKCFEFSCNVYPMIMPDGTRGWYGCGQCFDAAMQPKRCMENMTFFNLSKIYKNYSHNY